jgi:flagellar motor switch protein FliM
MVGDVLSQAEVESLLTAMEGGPKKLPDLPESSLPDLAPLARPREKVTPYDFKRPERVGKEQMRALQTLHEGFSRNFGAALSGLLRSIVEVKLTSVDQLTYSEFIFSLENPTCFNLLRAEPLEGNLILDINPSILYPIIDRLLGGGRDPGPIARRPLTEIELRLVTRITNLFLDQLRHAWENVVELKLSVERVESNPQLVQIVPPNEVVVLVSFELTLGDIRGMMNFCIPFNSIERIGNKLSSNSWISYGRRNATPESRQHIGRNIEGALVELIAELAETRITTGDLIGLRVGDIITTEKDVNEALVIQVEGVTKFRAHPGAFKGRKAIQIEQSIGLQPSPTK